MPRLGGTVELDQREEREIRLPSAPSVPAGRRKRRPTGSPPPLPRRIPLSGKLWLGLLFVLVVASVLYSRSATGTRLGDHMDMWLLQHLARVRSGWLDPLAQGLKVAGSGWGMTVLGLVTVSLLMIFRRWRHLLVFLGAIFVLELAGSAMYEAISRPRPFGVSIIGGWGGYSMPSAPVAFLAAILIGIAYTLVTPGRARGYAKIVITGIIFVFALARLYLGIDHPSDALFGIILGVAIPVTAFRVLTPNEAFPVAYRKAKAAHLDVTGRRGQAIKEAVRCQLGLDVTEIKPVGLEASGGSTPLRLRVEGEPGTYLFAKLYAMGHVRADRWYKLWRTILFGSLEDEAPFQSVRRLVEYEDYTVRLLWDLGISTARPYGIVEITPEREYLLVTEFLKDAAEISEVEVDDAVIDSGLLLIRKLWDGGLAHRDIKPANLLVRDRQVFLIDAFFVQVRPSPWRQAVDLGNMMLVLAVHTDPRRVYRRALKFFTPDELAEAFAATRGVASPTQLRAFMKRDGRDLLAEFRSLAPARPPIVLQRWSFKRVGVALAMVSAILISSYAGIRAFFPAQNLGGKPPECGTGHSMVLAAQAVPSASLLPCVASLPSGWQFGAADVHTGAATFWLDSDQAGARAVVVTLTPRCDTADARQVPSDQAGAQRFERPVSLRPRFVEDRIYEFPGGCAVYHFSFERGVSPTLALETEGALTFTPRADVVAHVERTEGLTVCGRGAPCPD